MQGSSRRRSITRNGGVASGSVWETRMKMDQVKGGIKVFNGDNGKDNGEEEGLRVYRRLVRNQSDPSSMVNRKRRSWRQPEVHESGGSNAIELKRSISELSKEKESVSVEEEEEEEEEKEVEIDKEMDLVVVVDEGKSEAEEKVDQVFETPAPTPAPAREKIEPENIDLRAMHPDPVKPPSPVSHAKINEAFEAEEEEVDYQYGTKLGDHNRMQSIVDLVMWRDISKSAFVFGFGSFFLLSTSYAKDLEFSLISAVSYLGLVYLALIFVYKSILQRGAGMEYYDEMVVIGEEEATWIVRFLLPYINEILLNIKALFSGDPATTMKLAVALFVMARCGSSITIWTLSKLLFFGVFTIPKLCSSSSFQLARYGKFWLERVKDGWDSCTHKKAVAGAVFTVLWNLSSTVARIWGIFMLLVAMKFYQQQCMVVQEWNVEEVEEVVQQQGEDSKAVNGPVMGPSLGSGPRSCRQHGGPLGERKLKKWN